MSEDVYKPLSEFTEEELQSVRAAQDLFLGFHESCQSPVSSEDLSAICEEIQELRLPFNDNLSYVFAQQSLQRKSRERAEAEQRSTEREAQLRAEQAEYLRPSDRAEAAARQQSSPERAAFKPARTYTDEELEAMPSDVYRREVLGVHNIEDCQGTSGYRSKPEQTTRKSAFVQSWLASSEARQRVIDQDKAERRKVTQDLEKAQREELERNKR